MGYHRWLPGPDRGANWRDWAEKTARGRRVNAAWSAAHQDGRDEAFHRGQSWRQAQFIALSRPDHPAVDGEIRASLDPGQ